VDSETVPDRIRSRWRACAVFPIRRNSAGSIHAGRYTGAVAPNLPPLAGSRSYVGRSASVSVSRACSKADRVMATSRGRAEGSRGRSSAMTIASIGLRSNNNFWMALMPRAPLVVSPFPNQTAANDISPQTKRRWAEREGPCDPAGRPTNPDADL
jgi:hypothetical protein